MNVLKQVVIGVVAGGAVSMTAVFVLFKCIGAVSFSWWLVFAPVLLAGVFFSRELIRINRDVN